MTSIVAGIRSKLYPDNYLSIGFAKKQGKIRKREKEYNKDYENQFDSYIETNISYRGTTRRNVRFRRTGIDYSPLLDISPESSQTPRRYGKSGITTKGRRTIRASASLLQRTYGKGRLGFATLTIPNFPAPKVRYLAERWNDIVRVFYQKFKRIIEKKKAPHLIIGCTEIQPRRYEERGEICPHLPRYADAGIVFCCII